MKAEIKERLEEVLKAIEEIEESLSSLFYMIPHTDEGYQRGKELRKFVDNELTSMLNSLKYKIEEDLGKG